VARVPDAPRTEKIAAVGLGFHTSAIAGRTRRANGEGSPHIDWTAQRGVTLPPLALPLALGVTIMALVVAAAGEGRLDRLPPQEYFAPALFRPAPVACDHPDFGGPGRRTPAIDDFLANWYSTHLRAAQEPSLYLASTRAAPGPTYRFTWLRSFHEPVVFRVDARPDGAMIFTAKKLSGYGGYGPGRVEARVDRALSTDVAARFRRMLSTSRLFDLPPKGCGPGPDGADWIFEANEGGAYRYVARWAPENGPVREAGLLLMSFTGWKLDPIY